MVDTVGSSRCACGLEFHSTEERVQCPGCGATIHQVSMVETAKAYDGHKMTVTRGGMSRTKGWFIRCESIPKPQVSRAGRLARVDRVYDRDIDLYKEKVLDCETGELIYEIEEKLSDHKGHGSDKRG